jgi:hypothetical protein
MFEQTTPGSRACQSYGKTAKTRQRAEPELGGKLPCFPLALPGWSCLYCIKDQSAPKCGYAVSGGAFAFPAPCSRGDPGAALQHPHGRGICPVDEALYRLPWEAAPGPVGRSPRRGFPDSSRGRRAGRCRHPEPGAQCPRVPLPECAGTTAGGLYGHRPSEAQAADPGRADPGRGRRELRVSQRRRRRRHPRPGTRLRGRSRARDSGRGC